MSFWKALELECEDDAHGADRDAPDTRNPPSPPPPEGRQDFEVDAADVASLLDARPHIVALIRRVRSLTLIEPPLYYLVPSDPEVARLERMGNAVLTQGLEADAATLREFLRLAGAPEVDDGPLPDDVAR